MIDIIYGGHHPKDLEPHFSRHMQAIATQMPHNKAFIAAELAYRDKEIDRLKTELCKAELKGETE